MAGNEDRWARWLLGTRHGGDAALRERMLADTLYPWRDEILDRCTLVQASADSLAGVADGSADVVTTRSVLIYVKDKAAALREFCRVLRPGGRVSLFEPVNRLMRDQEGRFSGYDVRQVAAIAGKVRTVYEAIQPPDSDPMLDLTIVTWCGLRSMRAFPTSAWTCAGGSGPRCAR